MQTAVWQLVEQVRAELAHDLHADGFNIGLNDGTAAGQTVMHARVHVIQRFNLFDTIDAHEAWWIACGTATRLNPPNLDASS